VWAYENDKIKNEIQSKVQVAAFEDKIRESRLRLFGHMKQRLTYAPVRKSDYVIEP